MQHSELKLEESLREIIGSGPLQEIKLYHVNENFFEMSDKGYWLIDGGVELVFPEGVVSAAWDSELDAFVFKNKPFETIYTQSNFIELYNENIAALKKYIGLNVIYADFKSLEFSFVADYTMRIEKERRIVEMVLEFQNTYKIQIALVNYKLEPNEPPKDFSFGITTNILISIQNVIAMN